MTLILRKTKLRSMVQMMLAGALTIGCASAQDLAYEKHVKDIRAEQTQKVIEASPLCRLAMETSKYDPEKSASENASNQHEIDLATLEPDMESLMEKSDEVVVGNFHDITSAISPSGKYAIYYLDITVLHSWKGAHKVGDILTFGIPHGGIRCPQSVRGRTTYFWTGTNGWFWDTHHTPLIVFLRHSRGRETQLIAGYRLTGGDGLQGMFPVQVGLHSDGGLDCDVFRGGNAEKCIALLEENNGTISATYYTDELSKKYDGMRLSSFLKEVQSAADSLGYTAQTESRR